MVVSLCIITFGVTLPISKVALQAERIIKKAITMHTTTQPANVTVNSFIVTQDRVH